MPGQPSFYLDECLPYQVARALALVHYPISNPIDENKRSIKDSPLIAWMAKNDLTWITKDDEAKRDHLADLIKGRINTVWIRGIDRIKNKVTAQQVHLMLTTKLPTIIETIEEARGPRHFVIWLRGQCPVMEVTADIGRLLRKQVKHSRRR